MAWSRNFILDYPANAMRWILFITARLSAIKKGEQPASPPLFRPPDPAPDPVDRRALLGGLGGWQHVHEHAAAGLLL
ncbi:MAG: hypothetical protein VXB94_08270, partial [Rhodobiaceae bacterium]